MRIWSSGAFGGIASIGLLTRLGAFATAGACTSRRPLRRSSHRRSWSQSPRRCVRVFYKIPRGRRCTDGPGGSRAAEIRDAASRGYACAGICAKAAKTVIGAIAGVLWGAEIRGRDGRVGAQRARRGDLAALSAELALLGASTRDLVRWFVGSWVSVFLYRRPLSIFGACFAWSGESAAIRTKSRSSQAMYKSSYSSPHSWRHSPRLTFERASSRS